MLRDYQERAIHNVYEQWQSGHRETLLVAATGAGKTQMYLSIGMDALDVDPDARALVIAHRRELIEQPIERIKLMNAQWLLNGSIDRPRVGVITQGRCDTDRQLTVATVQSMNERRTTELLRHGPITHLITDEAHHVVAGGYLRLRSQLLEANPNLLHLGVTATPMRADGDGLRKVYTSVADRISIADLVRQGWLVKPRWLGVSTAVSLSGVHTRAGDYVASELADAVETESMRRLVVQSYQQYAAGRRFIAFTVTVDGAHKLAEAFVEAGLRVKSIDGGTPLEERASILAAYRKGELDGLTNCQVLTEGFDAPGTSCILMCRPTRSDGLYVQCMGRGLRPARGRAEPGEDCLILDFIPADARNVVMAGDVLGIPKEQARAIRELAEDEAEEGAVQVGFTFDGERIDASGTPLEIVARQIDYLQASTLAWYPPRGTRGTDDILTVGLGRGRDNNERILAVRNEQLYGLIRYPQPDDSSRYGPWKVHRIEEATDIYARAEAIAEKWGVETLMNRGTSWRGRLISEKQASYLARLARGRLKLAAIRLMTAGEAAQAITHYQALDALGRADV
jgi:superfamily II DNA or RNA helicase